MAVQITPHKKTSGPSTPLTNTRKVTEINIAYDKPVAGLAAVHLDTISGGATTLTWYVAEDAVGDVPLTPEVTDTILSTPTAGKGGVTRTLDVGLDLPEGKVYFVMVLDVGVANGVPSLTWRK